MPKSQSHGVIRIEITEFAKCPLFTGTPCSSRMFFSCGDTIKKQYTFLPASHVVQCIKRYFISKHNIIMLLKLINREIFQVFDVSIKKKRARKFCC